jgi:chemotaxis signal transduction protein
MQMQMKTMDQAATAVAGKMDKYLIFSLAKEDYGISILKIKEIIGMTSITHVPQTPGYVKGVINLRGKVIPVIDLRLLLGMEASGYTERTSIVVVEAQSTGMAGCWEKKNCHKKECPAYGNTDHRCWMLSKTLCRDEIQGSFYEKIEACRKCDFFETAQKHRSVFTVGVTVDFVLEVLNIKDEFIEKTPAFGTRTNTDYILGVAKMDGGVKILIDIDKVLNAENTMIFKNTLSFRNKSTNR